MKKVILDHEGNFRGSNFPGVVIDTSRPGTDVGPCMMGCGGMIQRMSTGVLACSNWNKGCRCRIARQSV